MRIFLREVIEGRSDFASKANGEHDHALMPSRIFPVASRKATRRLEEGTIEAEQ
jgi:hypothetical protein